MNKGNLTLGLVLASGVAYAAGDLGERLADLNAVIAKTVQAVIGDKAKTKIEVLELKTTDTYIERAKLAVNYSKVVGKKGFNLKISELSVVNVPGKIAQLKANVGIGANLNVLLADALRDATLEASLGSIVGIIDQYVFDKVPAAAFTKKDTLINVKNGPDGKPSTAAIKLVRQVDLAKVDPSRAEDLDLLGIDLSLSIDMKKGLAGTLVIDMNPSVEMVQQFAGEDARKAVEGLILERPVDIQGLSEALMVLDKTATEYLENPANKRR